MFAISALSKTKILTFIYRSRPSIPVRRTLGREYHGKVIFDPKMGRFVDAESKAKAGNGSEATEGNSGF